MFRRLDPRSGARQRQTSLGVCCLVVVNPDAGSRTQRPWNNARGPYPGGVGFQGEHSSARDEAAVVDILRDCKSMPQGTLASMEAGA